MTRLRSAANAASAARAPTDRRTFCGIYGFCGTSPNQPAQFCGICGFCGTNTRRPWCHTAEHDTAAPRPPKADEEGAPQS